MSELWLGVDVYCADVGDGVIFLDLRRGHYRALTRNQTGGLASTVRDWPSAGVKAYSPEDSNGTSAIANRLLAEGLLGTQQAADRIDGSVPAGHHSFEVADVAARPFRASPTLCIRFLQAYALWRTRVRLCSFHHLVKCLRDAKRQSLMRNDPPTATSLLTAMAHFLRLRALTYTARDRCLLDSLVLMEFLLRNGMRPTMIIGVATRPFNAHCWLQHDEWILNDTVERTAKYAPLLVI